MTDQPNEHQELLLTLARLQAEVSTQRELIAALREALAENERLSQRTYRGWFAAVISNPDGDKINNVYWSRVDAQRRVNSWLPGTGRVVDCCVVLTEGDPR